MSEVDAKVVERYLRSIKRYLASIRNKESKKLIEDFHLERLGQGRSVSTEVYVIRYLARFANHVDPKPISKADVHDVLRYLAWIREYCGDGAREQAAKAMKAFFFWLKRPLPPKALQWRDNSREAEITPLTEEEVMKMIEAADNIKHKALVAVLYDSGARPIEIRVARVKDVVFTRRGARLYLRHPSFLKDSRWVLLVPSAPYLQAWMEVHPWRDNPDAPLFPNEQGEFLTDNGLRKILQKLAKKAGIKKRITPYIMRHTSITIVGKYASDSVLMRRYGWRSRKMIQRYDHLRTQQADEKILEIYGVKEEPEPPKLKPKVCPRCKTLNAYDSKYCKTCGLILSPEKMVEEEQLINTAAEILSDEETADKLKLLVEVLKNLDENAVNTLLAAAKKKRH